MRRVIVLLMLALLQCAFVNAAEAPATVQEDPAYTADLNKRGDGMLEALKLDDAEKAARLKQIVMNQYRAIKKIDEATLGAASKDDKAAVAKAKEDAAAAKKPLHDEFLAKLSAELTPEQVETVKDKMTYNVVKVTYDGFQDMLPNLTETQKAYILAQLKEAREIAMDQGSSKEKHAVFGKYKGRINNYLAREGYDLKQASTEWAERRKAREAQAKQAGATQPAS
jgi:hypothetical protein